MTASRLPGGAGEESTGMVFVHGELWRAGAPRGRFRPARACASSAWTGSRSTLNRWRPRRARRRRSRRSRSESQIANRGITNRIGAPVDSQTLGLALIVVLVIFLIWFWNSLYILKEWERGAVLRLGRMIPEAKGAGLRAGVLADRDALPHPAARRDARRAAAGRHHARQRLGEGQRGRLLQGRRREPCAARSRELPLRDLAARADDAPERRRPVRAGRDPIRARQGQRKLQIILDQDTDPWGIKVTKVEVKQVDIPETMQRAIARQAEAERERRAKVIHADGEFQASQKLADAAKVLETQPASHPAALPADAHRDRRRRRTRPWCSRCRSTC